MSWESDKLSFRDKLLVNSPWIIIVLVMGGLFAGITLHTFSPDQVAKNKIEQDKYDSLEKQIDSMSFFNKLQEGEWIKPYDVSQFENRMKEINCK